MQFRHPNELVYLNKAGRLKCVCTEWFNSSTHHSLAIASLGNSKLPLPTSHTQVKHAVHTFSPPPNTLSLSLTHTFIFIFLATHTYPYPGQLFGTFGKSWLSQLSNSIFLQSLAPGACRQVNRCMPIWIKETKRPRRKLFPPVIASRKGEVAPSGPR